jgi:hypothetical protein
MNTQLSALCYLYAWDHGRPIAGGLAFEALLRRCQLDYSVASLKRVDAFLDIIRLEHKPQEVDFLRDSAQQNLLYLLAFYTGEVIGLSRGAPPSWHSYDEILALNPDNAVFGRAFYSSVCCRYPGLAEPDLDVYLPLGVIMARLFAPQLGKSVRISAEQFMPPACLHGPVTERPLPPLGPLQPEGWHVNVSNALARFSPVRRRAVNMTPPGWITGDPLSTLFEHEKILLEEGHIVWGALIQANHALFKPGALFSAPGEVLYDPAGRMPPALLLDVARRILLLKESEQNDPVPASTAEALADDTRRVFGMAAPEELLPYRLLISSTYFEQAQMPDMRMTLPWFPLLISERCPGVVLFLPSIFWPEAFREEWLGAGVRAAERAPNAADAPGLHAEGLAYFHGTGITSDLGKARGLWEQAAGLGHADSQFMLGSLAEQAGVHPVDLELALQHYRRAAQQGHALAQLALGKLYLRVDAPAPDLAAADEWLGKAADRGIPEARELLRALRADNPQGSTPGVLSWLRQRSR